MHGRPLAFGASVVEKRAATGPERRQMPTLLRFLATCLVLALTGWGIIFSLATFVMPTPREMTVRVSTDRLLQQPAQE